MDQSVEARPSVLGNSLDIEQLRLEARNQWLFRPQICELLRNYNKFGITSAPQNKPPSGSLFLFDRKVQRRFRNDGHNWKKKKDGKKLLEGHQLFKVRSFGDLDCYYAHGEKNRNFQRRSYWMREGNFSDIVLVHYLEVTGSHGAQALERGNSQPDSDMDDEVVLIDNLMYEPECQLLHVVNP